ncbi:hypothetical protein DKP78_20735, partial [Enterococcus faecium]
VGTSTGTEPYHSPESQWSDSSEDIELQLVTELVAQHTAAEGEQPIYGEMWTYNMNLLSSLQPMVSC